MEERVKDITTFGCPQGCFQFLRMPFGLKAPAIFQRVVEDALVECSDVSVN